MVGGAAVDVKFLEGIAGKSCDKCMYLVKQPELPGVGVGSGPVGDHMEVYQRLCPVCDPGYQRSPFERHKLDEHGWAVPRDFLIIMLPQKRTGLERKIVTKKRYADMGNNSRKQHGPEFKAKVALEALKEQATLPELEKKFGVSQYTISRWKNELLRNASQTFGATNDEEAHQKEVDNLHRKIGELEMMLDFAKRASRKLGVRLPEDL